MVDNRTQNKGDGKKVPAPDMPSGGGAYSGGRGSTTQCANVRELMGGARAPSVPGEQISPLLREEVNRQSPPLRAGIADIVRRKQAQS
jgi:hypothetical protein